MVGHARFGVGKTDGHARAAGAIGTAAGDGVSSGVGTSHIIICYGNILRNGTAEGNAGGGATDGQYGCFCTLYYRIIYYLERGSTRSLPIGNANGDVVDCCIVEGVIASSDVGTRDCECYRLDTRHGC